MTADERVTRRIETEPVTGLLEQVDGRWVLTMSRTFAHPPARVWRMLTDPERLIQWSPIVPDRPLTTTGPATSRETPDAPEIDLEVLVSDPPHELIHRWGTHLMRWTLTPEGDGTRLRLADTLDEHADGARNGAGWHLCLAVLAARLDGETVPRMIGPEIDYDFDGLRNRYDAALS